MKAGDLWGNPLGSVGSMENSETGKRFRIEPLLGGAALLLLLLGCFFVLRPFMTALMWAIILAYSLHPLQRMFTKWFRGSRTLAACFVTLTLTIVLAGPVVLLGFSLAQDGKDLANATRKWFMAVPEQAPPWVGRVPMVGEELQGYWASLAGDRSRLMTQLENEVKIIPPRAKIVVENGNELGENDQLAPLADASVAVDEKLNPEGKKLGSPQAVVLLGQFLSRAWGWMLSGTLAVGQGVTQVLVSAFLAFFLLRDAPVLAERLRTAADRLAGSRGHHLLKVAGDTVRGVIYGIFGTAIVQGLCAGLGFYIANVPGSVLLSVLTFFFAVIPFGPPLIWIPAAVWLFAQSGTGWGIFMCLWGIFVISGVDNFLRPYLISHGSKMPFVLIFCGVIGGIIAFGLVGVFLGPTMLAVGFRVVEEWSSSPLDPEHQIILGGSLALQTGAPSATPTHVGESLGVR